MVEAEVREEVEWTEDAEELARSEAGRRGAGASGERSRSECSARSDCGEDGEEE